MNKFDRQVLAIETAKITDLLSAILASNGFLAFSDELSYAGIVNQALTGRRGDLEEDIKFKQIIPYLVMLNDKGEILYYIRNSKETGDARLHDKFSIGVGGHIEVEDVEDPADTILVAAGREAKEEFGDGIELINLKPLGFIYREDTPVDQVHIGILFSATLRSGSIDPDPTEIKLAEFVAKTTLAEMMQSPKYSPETWTKIVWDFLKEI